MARNLFQQTLFQPGQLKPKEGEFKLQLVHEFAPPVEEVVEEEVPEYTGPTADDLRREAEAFKAQWEQEKQQMLQEAQAKADEIVKKAEDAAFAEVKRQTNQAQVVKNEAEQNAAEIIKNAQEEASRIIEEAKSEQDSLKKSGYSEGVNQGREEGFSEGKAEVERLIERTHKILEGVMARREEILSETEQQIVELVILMTRKVVKIISENQKSVVMANILQALKKVKGRGNVTVRVNMSDVKLTTEHIQDFIKQVENVQGITVLEDSSVDKGGCVVETDFGAIDAKIQSQLSELETAILEISPVKTIQKNEPLAVSEG
ncbi:MULTISPECIES: flagellar assembly protein FliH [unclassified Treponema]|uniref:flagellar assembly protein FliH n=1 Tax=unclassified Treponema TaxID=2638727 RepID=UPI001B078C80|nr:MULTISPECIES: flagellar assembly protein FliH [unclassified Treponema]MBO6220222.1 flagellar assembly protein FliH [Treponema sp.]MBQ8679869.1 flagellar assembly protein FliH [Treponema sp.]